MTIELVLPTVPKVGLEVFTSPFDQCYTRIYSTDGNGAMDGVGDYAFATEPGSGPTKQQLQNILTYCGITEDATVWLASKTKDQAVNAILKWIREVFIPLLTDAVNRFCGTSTGTPEPFTTLEQLMENIITTRLRYSVGADGKVSATV